MACPICNDSNGQIKDVDGLKNIECRRCGTFLASQSFIDSKPKSISHTNIGKISGWVYEHRDIVLTDDHWAMILALPEMGLGEKAEKLLQYLAKKFPRANQELAYQASGEELACCYAEDRGEGNFLFHKYLKEFKGYISEPTHGGQPVTISPEGWDYLHSLRSKNSESSIGFCAMWFHKSMDLVYDEAIEEAIIDAGYKALRIDKHDHNNRIDDEIIVMIKQSKFVVADFTDNRGGVYFEAGYALGMGLPVIWTVREDELSKIHFDTRQYSFVVWNRNDLQKFRSSLKNRIIVTIGRGPHFKESEISQPNIPDVSLIEKLWTYMSKFFKLLF